MDIAYSFQHLSKFMQSPRVPHLKAAYHVLKYLKQDPTMCYSDWAACPESRRSVSGYLVLMGDSHISWKSKKQAI
uniref:Reverse transcriptase Ty1/copia-type domain-containing protein n=1 Tax=Solanum lycopersicum TaxID=4081 RepID=A0A3Q7G3Z9_SOLLC